MWCLFTVAEEVDNIGVETTNYNGLGGLEVLPDTSQHRSTFGNLSSPLQHSSSEGTGQVVSKTQITLF